MKLCISKCPSETSYDIGDLICMYDEEANFTNILPPNEKCWAPYASTDIFYRCIPNFASDTAIAVIDNLNSRDFVSKLVSDVFNSWKVILVAVVGSLVLGLIWLISMRFCSGFFIWFSVWACLLLLCGISTILFVDGQERRDLYFETPPEERLNSDEILYKALLYTSYILIALSCIVFLMILCCCARIQLAVVVTQEASKAIGSMLIQLLLWPLIPFIFIVILLVYFVAVAMYAVTTEKPAYENSIFKGYEADNVMRGLLIYHLLGLLWTLNWIIGISQVTMSGAIADWYWSVSGKNMKAFPVIRSFGRAIRYHAGSVAFGSLILGIVQLLRLIVLYFVKKMKGYENVAIRGILKFLLLILTCLKKCVEFLNKNAYVMIAIYGYSFCKGARRGFEILASNPLRIVAVKSVNAFNMFIGKAIICLTTTIVSYIYLKNYENLYFYFFPVGIIAIFSWAIASVVMTIYDMAVHTILYCFIEDELRNDGSEDKPYAMSDRFRSIFTSTGGICCC